MKFYFAGGLYLALCAGALAQQVLTNEAVEKMAKARLGDDVIVSMIQSQAGHPADRRFKPNANEWAT